LAADLCQQTFWRDGDCSWTWSQPPSAPPQRRKELVVINFAILVLEKIVVLGIGSKAVHIVREYQRVVVFRLGKCIGARGPGPVWMVPFVDRPVLVDQRELYLEVPHQSCITQHNVPIRVDFLIYRQVVDAVASVVAVQNFAGASQGARSCRRSTARRRTWTPRR
jgi:regulator of protease activity HflC (stomatin/prohibitin superfamily)